MGVASDQTVDRVRRTVEAAAAEPLERGRASLRVCHLRDITGEGGTYDCPVVMLTPEDPEAAPMVIEVQEDELWWVNVADGPGTELYLKMPEDRWERLTALVRAVVGGAYSHGPDPSSRTPPAWTETYNTERGPITSTHFGPSPPAEEHRFAPY